MRNDLAFFYLDFERLYIALVPRFLSLFNTSLKISSSLSHACVVILTILFIGGNKNLTERDGEASVTTL